MRVVVAVLLLSACASSPSPIPTPEHPLLACIYATPNERGSHGGTILPEMVHVVGITPAEDGERYMVIRGVFNRKGCMTDTRNPYLCPWLPYAQEEIHTRCGQQTRAFAEIESAP